MATTPFSIFTSGRKSYKVIQSRNASSVNTSTTATGETAADYKPSKFDKRVLVWNRKFPSLSKVPERVSQVTMERARNVSRIKLNVWLTVLTALACLGVAVGGKLASKSGDTMTKRNLEWHERCNTKV